MLNGENITFLPFFHYLVLSGLTNCAVSLCDFCNDTVPRALTRVMWVGLLSGEVYAVRRRCEWIMYVMASWCCDRKRARSRVSGCPEFPSSANVASCFTSWKSSNYYHGMNEISKPRILIPSLIVLFRPAVCFAGSKGFRLDRYFSSILKEESACILSTVFLDL